jgi:TolB-like protein
MMPWQNSFSKKHKRRGGGERRAITVSAEENSMVKKIIAVTVMVLAAGLCFGQQVVVAVFPFEARSGTSADDANTVTEVFNIKLQATGALRTVGRNVIDNVIKQEHIYQMSDISNDEKTAQLKKGLNADWVVYGVVTRLGRTFVITATLIDLNTNETMGGAPMQMDSIEEAFEKMDGPITEMIQRLTRGGGAGTAQGTQRPGGGAGAPGTQVPNLGIEVSTKFGGTLYFQDEEVAMLWDNDTYTIPIERPGTYTVRLALADGSSQIRTVSISARGIVKVNFLYKVGDLGPGGGIVFFAEGGKYMEVSGILGTSSWGNALATAYNHRGGDYSDWRLPTKDELNLVYLNLRAKNIGGLGDSWHWSSSEGDDSNYAWGRRFRDGGQGGNHKSTTYSVRAVRAF